MGLRPDRLGRQDLLRHPAGVLGGALALGQARDRILHQVQRALRRDAHAAGTGEDRLQLCPRERRQVGRIGAQLRVVEGQQDGVDRSERLVIRKRRPAFAQHHLGEVVGGVAGEELVDHARQLARAAAGLHVAAHLQPRLLELFPPVLGLGGTLLRQLGTLAVLRHVAAQLLLQHLEDRHVLVELGDQAIDDIIHALEQLALLGGFAVVALAGLGHGVEQPPRRMLAREEHAAVGHRDLDVGHQHPPDLVPYLAVVLRPIQEDVEQQCDQVDGVLVQAIQLEVVAGDADLACAAHHLLAQLLPQRELAAARRIHAHAAGFALQQVQHRQEVARCQYPGRPSIGFWYRAGGGRDCAPAPQQAQQPGEQRLVRRADVLADRIGRCRLTRIRSSRGRLSTWRGGRRGFGLGDRAQGRKDPCPHQRRIAPVVDGGKHCLQLALEELEHHDPDRGVQRHPVHCIRQRGGDEARRHRVGGRRKLALLPVQPRYPVREQFQRRCVLAGEALGQLFGGQLLLQPFLRQQAQGPCAHLLGFGLALAQPAETDQEGLLEALQELRTDLPQVAQRGKPQGLVAGLTAIEQVVVDAPQSAIQRGDDGWNQLGL